MTNKDYIIMLGFLVSVILVLKGTHVLLPIIIILGAITLCLLVIIFYIIHLHPRDDDELGG